MKIKNSSINLSTSGNCPYQNTDKECIDCYSKYILNRTQKRIRYNIIRQNSKQKNNDSYDIELVRISDLINFNFTIDELIQLEGLKKFHTDKKYLIWSNISSWNLINQYPKYLELYDTPHITNTILTINPLLDKYENCKFVNNIYIKGFVFKYIPENLHLLYEVIEYCKKHNKKLLIIFQRFRKKDTMNKYSNSKYYERKNNYFKLEQKYRKELYDNLQYKYYEFFKNNIYFCDFNNNGCSNCNNCYNMGYGY